MDPSLVIPDSTDWIATSLPAFEPLEAALRCEVCKEFYENPVITSCSHTFCSLCIRRCITSDGKCPTCRTANQADKLVPNNAVREIVFRFQEARPKALELARQDTEEKVNGNGGKKRKLEEADIAEKEPVRQTRSRQTRSKAPTDYGFADAPIEVPDSEDGGDDEDFIPDGMVKCPMCMKPMKEVQVYSHLDVCPGADDSTSRSTRSKKTSSFPNLQRAQKDSSPAPTRLPGINYALMNETKLRKKLSELGIPSWGNRNLLIKRHTEWLHLWNSNCDSSENTRKSKRELLKELDAWEKTQGGHANAKESDFMRKDFDGVGHASTHKNQFDDLIANARKKAKAPKSGEQIQTPVNGHNHDIQEGSQQQPTHWAPQQEVSISIDPARPYEGNESALSTVREKVSQANHQQDPSLPQLSQILNTTNDTLSHPGHPELGMQNPLASPSRRVPMFEVPKSPVIDVENSTSNS